MLASRVVYPGMDVRYKSRSLFGLKGPPKGSAAEHITALNPVLNNDGMTVGNKLCNDLFFGLLFSCFG